MYMKENNRIKKKYNGYTKDSSFIGIFCIKSNRIFYERNRQVDHSHEIPVWLLITNFPSEEFSWLTESFKKFSDIVHFNISVLGNFLTLISILFSLIFFVSIIFYIYNLWSVIQKMLLNYFITYL